MKLTTPTSKMKKSKSKTAGDEDDEQEEEDQATVAPPDISERGEFGEDDDKKTRCVKGFCTLVKWLGLITGMLTLVLWAIHVYDKKVSASLPVGDADFFEDINLSSWRNTLFSFNPDVFVDAWTPFIMGLMAILMHFEKFHMPVFTAGWFRFC
ncbi:transmembrane protein, partial [Cystoisospora suis]